MIGKLLALILLGSWSFIQASEDSQQISLTAAKLGDNVTFQCPVSDKETVTFYWHKQPIGYLEQTISDLTLGRLSLHKNFKDSRFIVRQKENQHFLTITNVTKEDEGIYFCRSGTKYTQTSINGTFLSVNDPNQQNQFYVKQTTKTDSVHLGDFVTLECSLLSKNQDNMVQSAGEHSVYWFRSGSHGFYPSVIFKQTNSNNRQMEQSCVYSMSRTIQNSSDAGTYYCAVVTCGQILFGEGTNVEIISETSSDPLVLVLGVLLVCCVTVIIILICFMFKRNHCFCKAVALGDSHHIDPNLSTVHQSNALCNEASLVNYAALDFSKRKLQKEKNKESSHS